MRICRSKRILRSHSISHCTIHNIHALSVVFIRVIPYATPVSLRADKVHIHCAVSNHAFCYRSVLILNMKVPVDMSAHCVEALPVTRYAFLVIIKVKTELRCILNVNLFARIHTRRSLKRNLINCQDDISPCSVWKNSSVLIFNL